MNTRPAKQPPLTRKQLLQVVRRMRTLADRARPWPFPWHLCCDEIYSLGLQVEIAERRRK